MNNKYPTILLVFITYLYIYIINKLLYILKYKNNHIF